MGVGRGRGRGGEREREREGGRREGERASDCIEVTGVTGPLPLSACQPFFV